VAGRQVEAALHSIGVRAQELSAIFVTHEHSDHIKGVGILARRTGAAVYANERTWAAMERQLGQVPLAQRRAFDGEQDFYVGDIAVQPYQLPHDAADPVGYCLYAGGKKVAIATDLGHVSRRIADRLSGADVLLLESNHDVAMLEGNPRYPAALKRRIRGSRGHLSNDQCAEALLELLGANVRRVYLAHLSEHNNTPDVALSAVKAYLAEHNALPGRDLSLDVAAKDGVGAPLAVW
jgi:phosphoribosyl 1,2-cyclic phosphodiesterase